MELWIRSQDKICLTKVKHLYIDKNNNIRQQEDLILGTYESKERALEVLDNIHQLLIDLQTLEIVPDFYKICKRSLDNVYEMPKE